jgi:hypothetical protein
LEYIDSPQARLEAYCELFGTRVRRRLGFGKDGSVWLTTSATALKVFDSRRGYVRETAVYDRLTLHGVTEINGSAVPRLIAREDSLGVIEMSFVNPPFVLDFASAELDAATEFPEEVLAEWWTRKREEFGACWGRAVGILRSLQRIGIFMMDVHPGNIRFPEMDSMGGGEESSSRSDSP